MSICQLRFSHKQDKYTISDHALSTVFFTFVIPLFLCEFLADVYMLFLPRDICQIFRCNNASNTIFTQVCIFFFSLKSLPHSSIHNL